MAATAFHQAIGTLQSYGLNNLGLRQEIGDGALRLPVKGFKVELGLSKRAFYSAGSRNFGVIRASGSQTSVADPPLSPSNKNTSEPRKKSSELLGCVNLCAHVFCG